jgi:membrane-bound serine protease (ClpP class)
MRSTAQANNRNPTIAEAMVDEDVVLDSTIKAPGKILSFTTSEAMANGYCEGQVKSIEELLEKNQVTQYNLVQFELSAVDSLIGFFLNPVISGILLMMIIGGIYYEIQAPGLGLPGLLALIGLVLYLIPYYATGLAEYWEIIAFIVGLALIAAEIFVIPGFGIAGISGIVVVVGSLVLIMLNNNNFDFELVEVKDIWVATVVALSGVLGGIIFLFVGGSNLHRTKMYKHIAHMETMDRSKGYTSSFLKEPMTGKKGVSQTVLRPGGKVLIDGVVYDAYTMGEYIEPGKEIEVIGDETTSLRVRNVS